jgi:hypothetical protein
MRNSITFVPKPLNISTFCVTVPLCVSLLRYCPNLLLRQREVTIFFSASVNLKGIMKMKEVTSRVIGPITSQVLLSSSVACKVYDRVPDRIRVPKGQCKYL